MQEIKKAVGEAIKAKRIHEGVTQEDLAARIEVSARSVQRFEAGQDLPKMSTLFNICNALNAKPDDFINPAWKAWGGHKR